VKTQEEILTSDALFGWVRCSHENGGNPGCRICDQQKLRVYDRYEFLLERERTVIAAIVTDLARRHAWAMALYTAFKNVEKTVVARIEHDHALTSKSGLIDRVIEVIREQSKKELDHPIFDEKKAAPPCPGCNGKGDVGEGDEAQHCIHCGGDGKLDVARLVLMKKRGAEI
jgi:hypothetical protein